MDRFAFSCLCYTIEEFSDGDGSSDVASEAALSKERSPSGEYVVGQATEKSDAENDDEYEGQESPLSEMGSQGEDGQEQVLLATAYHPVFEKSGAGLQ